MRSGLVLAMAGLVWVGGCGFSGSNAPKSPDVPATTQLRAPYHIDFDKTAAKPNRAGVALPAIRYTADSKTLERRASLVVRVDATGAQDDPQGRNRVIMYPIDLPGSSGTLPASYVDTANQQLAKLFALRCLKGTIKVNVALVRSSIKPDAGDTEINAKRLTDWAPTEVVFKNPHPKC